MALFPGPANSSQAGVLDTVPSTRQGGGTYDIRIGKDNVFYCSCPGWLHSRKTPKMCRHLSMWVVENASRVLDVLIERLGDGDGDSAAQKLIEAANSYDGKRL